MRMKRKKNLDERIAASSDYLITMKNESLDFQDAIKENHLLDFKKTGYDNMLYNVWHWKVVFFFSSLISKINSNPDKSSSQLHNLSAYPPHWVVWSRLEDKELKEQEVCSHYIREIWLGIVNGKGRKKSKTKLNDQSTSERIRS